MLFDQKWKIDVLKIKLFQLLALRQSLVLCEILPFVRCGGSQCKKNNPIVAGCVME